MRAAQKTIITKLRADLTNKNCECFAKATCSKSGNCKNNIFAILRFCNFEILRETAKLNTYRGSDYRGSAPSDTCPAKPVRECAANPHSAFSAFGAPGGVLAPLGLNSAAL